MKKSLITLLLTTIASLGVVIFGFAFINNHAGNAVLTEKTIYGDVSAANNLKVGFKADSNDNLHWTNSFTFANSKTESSFKRGEMDIKKETSIYEDIRFTGWSVTPYCTMLDYAPVKDIQNAEIHRYYEEIQKSVMEAGHSEAGIIRVKDYLDYYPISFRFQFGSKVYNSDDALTGLKIYDLNGQLQPDNAKAYNAVVKLYTSFNTLFRIPVIDNEYQKYSIKKLDTYDKKTMLGYETEIVRYLDSDSDYYEFDPIIVLQEENIMDGVRWEHKDLSGGISYEIGEEIKGTAGKTAADYNLKNRLLFIVNNRTVKGKPIDVSQLSYGFGVYELPIEIVPTATIRRGQRSEVLRNPLPLADQLSMVYPLDEDSEYVEISLSKDHKYVALFSVSDGLCNVEIADADTWETKGSFNLFHASEFMTYAWGEDDSLAITNNYDSIAIIARNSNDSYEVVNNSQFNKEFIKAFFDSGMIQKENSYGIYNCCADSGLAVAVKDGKAALTQNILIGDEKNSTRTAALECTVIDKNGLLYWGKLLSDISDLNYDTSGSELAFIDASYSEKLKTMLIKPIRVYNRVEWMS